MKNIFKRYAWLKLVEGILLALVGILIAIFGGIDPISFGRAVSIVVAVFLFVDGTLFFGAAIADGKSKFSVNIITGAILIAIGVVLCLNQININDFLPYFVASVLLAIGGGELIKGIVQIIHRERARWFLLNFLIAAASIALGALCIIFINEAVRNIIYIIIGISIVVVASAEIVLAILAIKENRRKESGKTAVIIDDAEIIDDKKKEPKKITNKTKK